MEISRRGFLGGSLAAALMAAGLTSCASKKMERIEAAFEVWAATRINLGRGCVHFSKIENGQFVLQKSVIGYDDSAALCGTPFTERDMQRFNDGILYKIVPLKNSTDISVRMVHFELE